MRFYITQNYIKSAIKQNSAAANPAAEKFGIRLVTKFILHIFAT